MRENQENKYLIFALYRVKATNSSSEIITKIANKVYWGFASHGLFKDKLPYEAGLAMRDRVTAMLNEEIPTLLRVTDEKGGHSLFDETHKKICNSMMAIYSECNDVMTFGVAQRWLNQTLLDLTAVENNCCTGYWDISGTRKYFHVPVKDPLVEVATRGNRMRKVYQTGLTLKICVYEDPNGNSVFDWYRITTTPYPRKPYTDWTYEEYMAFQTAVRERVKELGYRDPLEWAFLAYAEAGSKSVSGVVS